MYERALKAQRDAGMHREQGVTLHNLGRAHENLQQWEAARAAFQESYDISEEIEVSARRSVRLARTGCGRECDRRQPSARLETLDRAAALQKQTPDARLNAQIQLARGVGVASAASACLPAVGALQEALQVFRQADSMNELRATYAELAAVLGGARQLARRLRLSGSKRRRPRSACSAIRWISASRR